MPFRRRREGKTDYKKRLKLLLSKKPRFVVRRSLRYITVQVVAFKPDGDLTLIHVNSKILKKHGWVFACDNLPSAYLTGFIAGKKAVRKVREAILDSGLYTSTPGSRIYAAVKGAIDAGLKIPVDEKMLPSEERIKGKHISEAMAKKVEEIKAGLGG